ncbi:hypothetical protein [Halalkalicoccus tibetensis]|uniref:Tat (Twin-arginine translocation) pathway signal sequence n=1 Tax=Halalkalicoccus tibetensis TaxID=175632 RepID=A0ABD5V1S9_9EURY
MLKDHQDKFGRRNVLIGIGAAIGGMLAISSNARGGSDDPTIIHASTEEYDGLDSASVEIHEDHIVHKASGTATANEEGNETPAVDEKTRGYHISLTDDDEVMIRETDPTE